VNSLKEKNAIEFPRDDDSNLSPRGRPQLPTHPGRQQDDDTKQVSWLPGHRYRPPSRRLFSLSGTLDDRYPVTVAGAAAVLNRVPLNPFREPRVKLNANGWTWRGSTFVHSAVRRS
jgi:hypothetical protein